VTDWIPPMRRWQQRPARPLLVALLALAWVGLLGALLFPGAESRSEAAAFAYQRHADCAVLIALVSENYPPTLARWLRFDEEGQLRDARRIFDLASRRGRFPEDAASRWALLFHQLGDGERAAAALERGSGNAEDSALRELLEKGAPGEGALSAVRERYFEDEDSALPDWVLLAIWDGDAELRSWLEERGHRLVRRGIVADAIAVASLLAALVAALWLWWRRCRGGLAPSLSTPRLPKSWGGWRFAQEILVAECLALIGAMAVSMPVFLLGDYDAGVLVSGLVFMVVPFLWLGWRLTPGPMAALRLYLPELRDRHSGRVAGSLAFGLLGFAILAVGVGISEATGFGIDSLGDSISAEGIDRALAIVSGFVIAAVLAPVFEELVFRGFLFGFLRSRSGAWPAALLSSGIFAAVHGYSGEGLVIVFLYGLVFAWLYHRSGSLLPGIVAHGVFNFVVTCQVVGWFSLH